MYFEVLSTPGNFTSGNYTSGNYTQDEAVVIAVTKEAFKMIAPLAQCVSQLPICSLNIGWELLGKGVPGLMWYLGKKISYLPDILINRTGELFNISVQSDIQKRLASVAWFFYDKTNLDKNTQNPLNVTHLIAAGCFLKFFSSKSTQNAMSVCKSISMLAKGILTGKSKSIYEKKLLTLPGGEQGDGLSASATILQQFTIKQLLASIGLESVFTIAWGSLAYGTQCVIHHAVSEALKNDPDAQETINAFNIISVVLAALPVLSALKQVISEKMCKKLFEKHEVSLISVETRSNSGKEAHLPPGKEVAKEVTTDHQVPEVSIEVKPHDDEELQILSEEELARIIKKINEAEKQRKELVAQELGNKKFELDIGQGTEKELQDLVATSRKFDIEQGLLGG